MQLLRAYLYARDQGGNWTVSPYRELEPLLDAIGVRAQARESAALHVGFWRPETAQIAQVADQWNGALLMSGSARGSMPAGIVTTTRPVSQVEGVDVYLVLNGLGYKHVDPSLDLPPRAPVALASADLSAELSEQRSEPAEWVADLQIGDPSLCDDLLQRGIFDEATYFAREKNLPLDARTRAGISRYKLLSGLSPDPGTIVEHLTCCPPWLLRVRVESLELTVRLRNVFNAHQLETVGSVAELGYSRILRLPNFGRGSAFAFGKLIWTHLLNGPPSLQGLDQTGNGSSAFTLSPAKSKKQIPLLESARTAPATFVDELQSAIRALPDVQAEVLTSRVGILRNAETLQFVSDRLGVTRERVRQIQQSALGKIARSPGLAELSTRLAALLRGRDTPLLARGLSGLDPWFSGIDEYMGSFPELCEHLTRARFHVIDLGDVPVVTEITRSAWEKAKRSARALLLDRVGADLTEMTARALTDSALTEQGIELREELWAAVTADALWNRGPGSERTLAGLRCSAEDVVVAILSSSESPLHFQEIATRATALSGQYAPRRLHHAAAEVAYLFGRGIYGLKRHSPLSDDQLAIVRGEAESIILNGDPQRQWHADELAQELEERGVDFDGRLTKYVVNLALEDSQALSYLGRMVWGLKDAWVQESASRLDMRQAVIAVLEASGTPLSATEIKARIQFGRGVNEHFQIFPSGPLVRLGPALWGLSPRDLDPNRCEPLLQDLTTALRQRARGLHLTEVEELLALPERSINADARAVVALGASRGIKIDRGMHVYLEEWGESRRVSASDAVKRVLERLDATGATINEIHEAVNRLAERNVPRAIVSSVLQDSDAEWDSASGTWRRTTGITFIADAVPSTQRHTGAHASATPYPRRRF